MRSGVSGVVGVVKSTCGIFVKRDTCIINNNNNNNNFY